MNFDEAERQYRIVAERQRRILAAVSDIMTKYEMYEHSFELAVAAIQRMVPDASSEEIGRALVAASTDYDEEDGRA